MRLWDQLHEELAAEPDRVVVKEYNSQDGCLRKITARQLLYQARVYGLADMCLWTSRMLIAQHDEAKNKRPRLLE